MGRMETPLDSLDEPLPNTPEKQRWPLDKWPTVIGTAVATIQGIQTLLNWKITHPIVFAVVMSVALLLVAWGVRRPVAARTTQILHWFEDRSFVKEQYIEMQRLVQRFHPFTSGSDTRSLIRVARSLGYEHSTAVVSVIVVSPCIAAWLSCFENQLGFPPTSLDAFLARYCEFWSLVNTFNRDCLITAQRSLTTVAPLGEGPIGELEQFREEFRTFLQAFEEWGAVVTKRAKLRKGDRACWALAPNPCFEKAKSFRREFTITVNGR